VSPDWRALSARASFASHRLIGWIYWDPVALENYATLGIDNGGVSYIVSRAAPLAPAGHQAVAATFYSISPFFIEFSVTLAKEKTTWEAIVAARNDAVRQGLTTYVPEICDDLASLAKPMWAAADALPVSGRALFAAHREQPRPEDDVLSAWLAVNCIREWRGDTHFAILTAEKISSAQAGILHNAHLNYPKDWIPKSRGTDDDALTAAMADLEARGLASNGEVNDAGVALRQRIEDRTDELCELPWRTLGEMLTTTYLNLVEPVGDALLARIDATAGTEWMPAARTRRA
jgi:hypothetical protein